ncbi:Uma2 family endonuclease [Floridanema evergladense]|uniref:Uma2 family endonuclease n=1 Tax=Floridaenema evergladense BLCC-F167 TaxID=3153639 RepID=A0ABV4WH48_9CYAN
MVFSSTFATDTWVKATWEEFLELADNPEYEKARFYYNQGYMRIEMAALGSRHGRQNSVIAYLIILFAALMNLEIVQLTNTSFKKASLREFQPDLAFYIGINLKTPPQTNSPVDLDEYDPPTLVVEISATSVGDDLGRKRLIYERAGVREYWVVDANLREAIAFSISERRSGEIEESLVLPGLSLALVNETLQRSQTEDDTTIMRWLMQIFNQG